MTETTPTPWLLDDIFGNIVMNDKDNKVIAYTQTREKYFTVEECKANAALIVKAVNCHAEMVEALTKLCLYLNELEQAGYGKCEDNPLFNKALAVLGRAGAI